MFYRQKFLLFVVLLLIGGICFAGFLILKVKEANRRSSVIENTSANDVVFNNQWPLAPIDHQQNSYLIRIVLEPELYIGKVEFGGYLIESWNYGLIKDSKGHIQKIAIPRSWYNLEQKKLFFLGTPSPRETEGYSSKMIEGIASQLDQQNQLNQNLVAAYFSPFDINIDPELSRFYENFSEIKLPESFILDGSVSDLPKKPTIGTFLPITQLVFDLQK